MLDGLRQLELCREVHRTAVGISPTGSGYGLGQQVIRIRRSSSLAAADLPPIRNSDLGRSTVDRLKSVLNCLRSRVEVRLPAGSESEQAYVGKLQIYHASHSSHAAPSLDLADHSGWIFLIRFNQLVVK